MKWTSDTIYNASHRTAEQYGFPGYLCLRPKCKKTASVSLDLIGAEWGTWEDKTAKARLTDLVKPVCDKYTERAQSELGTRRWWLYGVGTFTYCRVLRTDIDAFLAELKQAVSQVIPEGMTCRYSGHGLPTRTK